MIKHLLSILLPVLFIANPYPCTSASVTFARTAQTGATDDSSEKILKGHRDDNGNLVFSFEDNDFSFEASTFHFELSDDSYLVVWFSIVNKSSSPLNFKSGDVSVKMFKKNMEKDVPIEAKILNASEAGRALKAESEYSVKNDNKDFLDESIAQAAFDAILGFNRAAISSLERATLAAMAESSDSDKETQLKEMKVS